MKSTRIVLKLALLGVVACDTEGATTVVVDNDYPAIADGGDPLKEITVFKVWWASSLLPDAVSPVSEGQTQRAVPNTDFAYALLAPGWDRTSPTPPATLVVARSVTRLEVARGDTLHIHVSDDTFVGNCAGGKRLSQDDAAFITESIFPGEFAGLTYAAASCTAGPAGAASDASSTLPE